MRVGILTGGGDCPGLNAAIRGIVRRGCGEAQHSFCGFRHGWAGVLDGETIELTRDGVAGILPRGGTILGSSRTNPFARQDGLDAVRATFAAQRLDALVAIGGDDTLGVALRLAQEGLPVLGIPKTVDNDLAGTDFTFGFQTAVQIATEAIDRLHSTAESHDRVIVIEVMGRHAGWIATHAGIAGGADAILVPERAFSVQEVCARLRRRHDSGRNFSIVVAAEGALAQDGSLSQVGERRDAFGHVRLGGIGMQLAEQIEAETGYDTRATILGHVQRGGTPCAYDRVLATRFGVAAFDAAADRRFGQMVALHGTAIVDVPLAEALAEPKLLDPSLYETAEVFFG